jgi:hypothetical protein
MNADRHGSEDPYTHQFLVTAKMTASVLMTPSGAFGRSRSIKARVHLLYTLQLVRVSL